jgi:hypothetical protein
MGTLYLVHFLTYFALKNNYLSKQNKNLTISFFIWSTWIKAML